MRFYISSKAEQFLAWRDRGSKPPAMFPNFPEPDVECVRQVLRQLIAGLGYEASNPIQTTETTAMHMALAVIGLDKEQIRSIDQQDDGFLDVHACRQAATGRRITLFNRVRDS